MKQPAINSLFAAAKHYSQPASTQDKDYIVTQTAPTAKAKNGKPHRSTLKAQPDKPVIAEAPTSKGQSQKTACSTKQGKQLTQQLRAASSKRTPRQKGKSPKPIIEDASLAAADTLSLNSNSNTATFKTVAQKQPVKSRKAPSTKKRQVKEMTKDQSEVQLSKKQIESNKQLKRGKLTGPAKVIAPKQNASEEQKTTQMNETGAKTTKSAMAGLSAQTQALLKNALSKKPNTPQQTSSAPIIKPASVQKKQKTKTPVYETEIRLSDLSQDTPEFDQPVDEKKLQEKEPAKKPLLIPHPSGQSSVVSTSTLDLLKKIRTQGKQGQYEQAKQSPIPHLLAQQAGSANASPISNSTLSANLRLKHAELLKVKRELVLPIQMKQLIDVCRFIDESMNFLKRCRHNNNNPMILFSEVKSSVEKTFNRSISTSMFRQLLTIVPDFYSHNWTQVSTQRDPVLTIDFIEGSVTQKQLSFFQDRQTILKQRLTDRCISTYNSFLRNSRISAQNEEEQDLIENPLKYQLWHHAFDPHTQVPPIAEASLKAPPTTIRSQNVNDFLTKSSMPALVQDAISKAQADREMKVPDHQEEAISQQEDERLQALSKQTGLTIDTLRMIKKVENKVTQRKKETQKTMDDQMERQRYQTLTNLASQIRYIFQMRRTGTMQMNVLLEQLNERRNAGEFQEKSERMRQIEELAFVVPRWLTVKNMPSYGKIVKCFNANLNQLQVSKIIQDKVTE